MYNDWIELGKKKGLSELEIFAVRNKSLSLTVYQGKLDSHVQSDVEQVTLRGIYEGKLSVVRFENLSTKHVEHMIERLIDNAKALTVSEPAIIFEGSPSYPEVKEERFDFGSVPVTTKIEMLKTLEKTILDHPSVTQVQNATYQEIDTKTTLINSKGLHLTKQNTYAYAYAIGVFKQDDDIKTAYDVKLVKNFNEFNAKEMAETTIKQGVAKLGGKSISTKAYPTVFSNEQFSGILRAFTSIFSGEAAYRNLTSLKDKVGTKIFGDNITLTDDPINEKSHFKIPFDDEGVACSRRDVVKNGVFQGFNHNLKTSSIFKQEPTGNGFNGGISPTNLYLEPTDLAFEDLIKDIEDGVYITDLVGLHAGVKAISGEFSLQASGQKITNGKLDHAVKMIIVSGNFFEMMNHVKGIANDLKFELSGIGSPSVYIESLMIGGE